MWEYRHTDELYHYGILGMKWGKRKARPVTDKELSEFRKRKMAESQIHGAKPGSVGWWKNAPKATIRREYEADMKQQAREAKQKAKKHKAVANDQSPPKKEPVTSALDRYQENVRINRKMGLAGGAAKLAGEGLYKFAESSYNKYKNGYVTPRTATAVQGAAVVGKMLSTVGDMVISSTFIKQYNDWKKFMRS